MTKKQLIEALAEFPDDAIIDVQIRSLDDDFPVVDVIGAITCCDTTWVTLGLND